VDAVVHIDDQVGGVSIRKPRRAPKLWSASFGARVICADRDVRIESVTPSWRVAPRDYRVLVRSTDLDSSQQPPTRYISATGSAPDFAEPYASEDPMVGEVTPAVGTEISRRCTDKVDLRQSQELILVVEAGRKGADLKRIEVVWSHGGETGRVLLRKYRMVVCGTEVPPRLC
jgi:hypothetical protein